MLHYTYHHHLIVNNIIVNSTIVSLYMSSSSHCEYCHCSFINIIIHSLSVHSLLNQLGHVSCIKFLLSLIELLAFCVTSRVESFQTYPSRLMQSGTSYSCYLFSVFFVGCCPLSSGTWGWSCIAPLSSTGILLGLLIGRRVAAGPNVL